MEAPSGAAPAAPNGAGCAGAADLAAEASALADRLQQLAAAASSAALAAAAPPPEAASAGTCTDVTWAALCEWQEAEVLLESAEADLERSLARASSSKARHAAVVEELEAAAPELAAAYVAEGQARFEHEDGLRREAELFEADLAAFRESDELAASEERHVARLRAELCEAESGRRAVATETEALLRGALPTEERAARSAEEHAAELAAADVRYEELDEEKARLQEELGTLRFSLKDMKSYQHRRVQDLDAQAKKLEKQRRKLEDEQAVRAKKHQASEASEAAEAAGTEKQLRRLQQLNGLLIKQEGEVQEDLEVRMQQKADLRSEREELRSIEAREALEFCRANQRLDELSEEEGAKRRETLRLRNQAQLLHRQVEMLGKTASQTMLQLEEAESTHAHLKEEEQATERRAEIIKWKLGLAETHLRPHKSSRGNAGRGSSSAASGSTDSPTGGAADGSQMAGGAAGGLAGELAGAPAGVGGAPLPARQCPQCRQWSPADSAPFAGACIRCRGGQRLEGMPDEDGPGLAACALSARSSREQPEPPP